MRHLSSMLLSALALCASLWGGGCATERAVRGPTGPGDSTATLQVAPATDTLQPGAQVQLVARLVSASGQTTPVTARWSTSSSGVALVSASGTVTAVADGDATITASAGTRTATATVAVREPPPPPPPQGGSHAGWYVSPSGTSGGAGTAASPWDLATALAGAGGKVQPGDTVWLRGGTYAGVFRSTLTGSPSASIVVRQYPGERATIDGELYVRGANVTFWGFEITQSNPLATATEPGLETYAPGGRFVNLVIHDVGQQGITFWTSQGFSEVYGCIVYNAGTHVNLDHGIYAANDAGEKWITDNVFFNNFAYGIHVYGTTSHPVLTNVHVVGNASFNTGSISTGARKANLLIGGDAPTEKMVALDNMLYFSGDSGVGMRLGLAGRDNRDITARGNYSAGGEVALQFEDWQTAYVDSNTFIGRSRMTYMSGTPAGWEWTRNRFVRDPSAAAWRFDGSDDSFTGWRGATGLGASDQATATRPTTTKVFIRPNRYEPGRANIIIYNWALQASVPVDVSGVLRPGDRYVVKNVQDFFGVPVASGTYAGGTIAIPMSGVRPPPRIGRTTPEPPTTGPAFDVFVLMRAE